VRGDGLVDVCAFGQPARRRGDGGLGARLGRRRDRRCECGRAGRIRRGIAVLGGHRSMMIAAMSSALHVVRVGRGPTVLFIHGSAADHTTWSIQLAGPLRERFTLVAYDRRSSATTVEEHAADAATLLTLPSLVVGSSFGSVIALELVRARPTLCAG